MVRLRLSIVTLRTADIDAEVLAELMEDGSWYFADQYDGIGEYKWVRTLMLRITMADRDRDSDPVEEEMLRLLLITRTRQTQTILTPIT